MIYKSLPPEAEQLDSLLDHQLSNSEALDPKDAQLAGQILDLADAGVPADARFYRQLERKLLAAAVERRGRRLLAWPAMLSGTLVGAALLILVLLSGLLVPRLLGQPESTATQPAVAGPVSGPTAAHTIAPTAAPTPEPVVVTSVVTEPEEMAGGLRLETTLPDGPQTVPLYRQAAPGDPLTPQSALSMAAQLGVEGSLYQSKGESNLMTYTVSDGKTLVLFWGTHTHEFSYQSTYAVSADEDRPALPFEEQSRIAEEWLKSRGLLDFPYRIEPYPTDPQGVMVVQSLGEGSRHADNLYAPDINLRINEDGKVIQVIYRGLRTETGGEIPVLSAEEAWNSLKSSTLSPNTLFQTLDYKNQRSLQTWERVYQAGQPVDVYGYAMVIPSAEAGQPPLVQIGGLGVQGEAAGSIQGPIRDFLHAWGIYQVDGEGHAWLELQGWEPSPTAEVHLTGTIVQENGARRFKTEEGALYILPELPSDMPEGVTLYVSGAEFNPGEIQWRYIQTQIEMDDNLFFGSLPVPGVPLQESGVETPTLPETGYQPGNRVEGLEGRLYITQYEYTDGNGKWVHRFTTASQPAPSEQWIARLVGPGITGMEAYHNLPVKIWGTYGVEGSEVTITVDRYEPVWPGVKIEAWFGKVNERTIDGKNTLTLTDDSGKEWVLFNSFRFPQRLADMGWMAGDEIAVEGYPSITSEQIGGLPVLEDLSTAYLNHKGMTRETYELQTAKPQIEFVQEASPAALPAGSVDKVELVYHAQKFQGLFPAEEAPRTLVPLWRFSGTLDDGRAFEVLVPAERITQP